MHHVSQQTAVPTRRERVRAATIDEIKETALRLMHSTGTTDLKFSEIARAMGLTAPALYRYFADSDALLTELIVDAFDDLGAAVATARETVGTATCGAACSRSRSPTAPGPAPSRSDS